jgi:hypothetical protein
MSEYVAFIGTTPDGSVVEHVTVVVYGVDGELILQDEFPLAEGGLIPRSVQLEPRVYHVTAKADGYKFNLHESILISELSSTAADPIVVELGGTSTLLGGADSLPCRVYGRLAGLSPSAQIGGSRPSHVTLFPALHSRSVAHDVWFKRVGAAAGEMLSLVEKETIRVSVDRNGYFEALLKPEAVYRVSVPNVVGARYIRTPEAASEADYETLVDASRTESLSTLA